MEISRGVHILTATNKSNGVLQLPLLFYDLMLIDDILISDCCVDSNNIIIANCNRL